MSDPALESPGLDVHSVQAASNSMIDGPRITPGLCLPRDSRRTHSWNCRVSAICAAAPKLRTRPAATSLEGLQVESRAGSRHSRKATPSRCTDTVADYRRHRPLWPHDAGGMMAHKRTCCFVHRRLRLWPREWLPLAHQGSLLRQFCPSSAIAPPELRLDK